MPHSTRLVETSLGETHLTRAGDGDDTCLYLPGTNFNAATSTGVLALLSQRCRVVCADLPGQPGLSSAVRPPDGAADHARWVAQLLEAIRSGPGRTLIMGHSRGAAVALSAQPDSVDGLILMSPAGLTKVRLTARLLARTVPWLLRPTADRSAALVELMAGRPLEENGHLTEWMTLVARCTRTTGAPGPLPDDVLDGWRGRRARVLVGAGDVFFPPSTLEDPTRHHLGVELEVVRDAGHLLVDQRPEVVARALADELAAASRDAAADRHRPPR